MKRTVLAASLALATAAANADRISEMTREERCVYTARLQAAAAWQFAQGKPRQELKIHWHGDETPNEIEFVNHVIDLGYAAMESEARQRGAIPPVEVIGDAAYASCMRERNL